ncbi:MAG: hypothetical protein E7513_04445 [Ruminococcaceae bacterium]|nr:hypothetical protein [Oscillospiraceae bacterium]
MHIYPNYYKNFKCIASRCKHNCCIGWEIGIDENTLHFYHTVECDLSERFKNHISFDDTAHFILLEDERCPFLNNHNLCDIITTLGEEHICDICKEHPRFHNELPDRTESGLGLCCEEACRIILSQKEKMTLQCESEITTDDKIIILRDKALETLQNREKHMSERIDDMLMLCNTSFKLYDITRWCDVLLSFERMDDSWTTLLTILKENNEHQNSYDFKNHMADREHEYEQFATYTLYRHFANAPTLQEAQKRAKFTAFSYAFLYALGEAMYKTSGEFTFETQIDIARLFSSEIEYSDENLYTLFDML